MTNQLLYVLLMTPQEGQSPLTAFLPLVLIMVVFYFFMIRPQMKKQKETRHFRDGIKNGDKVVTVGGIYGKIAETSEATVILDVGNNLRLKVDKAGLVKDSTDLLDPSKK